MQYYLCLTGADKLGLIGGRRPLLSEISAESDPPPKNADFDRFLLANKHITI